MFADIWNAKRAVPQSNHDGRQIYTERGLMSGFGTKRTYRGKRPLVRFWSEADMP